MGDTTCIYQAFVIDIARESEFPAHSWFVVDASQLGTISFAIFIIISFLPSSLCSNIFFRVIAGHKAPWKSHSALLVPFTAAACVIMVITSMIFDFSAAVESWAINKLLINDSSIHERDVMRLSDAGAIDLRLLPGPHHDSTPWACYSRRIIVFRLYIHWVSSLIVNYHIFH